MKPQGDWKESYYNVHVLYTTLKLQFYVLFTEDDDGKVVNWLHPTWSLFVL